MKNKGFTLIELLLVVSVISLLSSVIMASLGDARGKAKLAVVKQEIDSIKKEAEIYYTKNNTYSSINQALDDCPTSENIAWGFLGTQKGIEIIKSLTKNAGGVGSQCAINDNSWAISIGTFALSSKNVSNVVYADSMGYICFDSSSNVIVELNVSGSEGEFRANRITTSQYTGKVHCN